MELSTFIDLGMQSFGKEGLLSQFFETVFYHQIKENYLGWIP